MGYYQKARKLGLTPSTTPSTTSTIAESTGSTYDLMRLVAQIPNKRIQEKLNYWTSEGSQRYLNDIRMHSPYYVLADRYMYDFHIDEWNAIKEFYEFL